MANKKLFSTESTKLTTNDAGGVAYSMTDLHAIAQLACTNTFNGTYYVSDTQNLERLKQLLFKVKDADFVAKLTVYARTKSYMKDMPAFLLAYLATLDTKLFRQVFPVVINNGKMLRNFVQIGRSGQAGKKLNMSAGACRKAINDWFAAKDSGSIFHYSIGNNPTMKDILKMSHVKPENKEKAALYAYLTDAQYDSKTRAFIVKNKDGGILYKNQYSKLPAIVKEFESFKKDTSNPIPKLDFRMLDSVLNTEQRRNLWVEQAKNGSWQLTRMNLNNFAKYGVFENAELTNLVAARLANKTLVKKSNVFPYQLLSAYIHTENVPAKVKNALQDAMEISVDNIPSFDEKVYVCVDTSGSMTQPITGRSAVPSKIRCVDVAGLIAASVLRKNEDAEVIPFDTRVHDVPLNSRDSVMTNAQKLARGGGGTDCSCALRHLNNKNAMGNLVIFVSDNESWFSTSAYRANSMTDMQAEWVKYKKRNPEAKLVCIDLTPNTTSQVKEQKDILQVGGFSDEVYNVIADFTKAGNSKNHWLDIIRSTKISGTSEEGLDESELV